MGYDVIGVDCSPEMLSEAVEKKAERFKGAKPPLFLCQRMEKLDLYGTVDFCICALDSINHLPDIPALKAAFSRVSLFLAPGGVFLFDVNTPHKHKNILRNNSFVFETGKVVCIWRNSYHEKNGRVDITLDFFQPERNGLYRRDTEHFSERIFTRRQLRGALSAAGLDIIAVYGENTLRLPDKRAERLVYVAGKK